MSLSRSSFTSVVVGAVITTAFTIVGSLVVARLIALDARLEYDLSRTPPLIGELEDARLYTLEVSNTGEREVKDVRIGIDFRSGTIQDFEIQAPPALELDDDLSAAGEHLLIDIPLLNPDDKVSTALLVDYGDSAVDPPEVDVRGEGVSGTPRDSVAEETSSWVTAAVALASTFVTTFGTLAFYRKGRRRR